MNTNSRPLEGPGSTKNEEKFKLTPAQRNALSSYLRVAEEGCRQVSRNLNDSDGVFGKLKDDLPRESKARLQSGIETILETLKRLKHHLDLECQETDLSRSVEAYLTQVWEVLCGSKSDSLRGFGEIPACTRDYLDKEADGMLALLTAMRQGLHNRTSGNEVE